jgi:hypothetical protein
MKSIGTPSPLQGPESGVPISEPTRITDFLLVSLKNPVANWNLLILVDLGGQALKVLNGCYDRCAQRSQNGSHQK